jgi:hypothetical protein
MATAEYRDGEKGTGRAPSPRQEVSDSRDQQQRVEISVDDSHALTSYTNFCRVTGTPEELIIDFGVNSQPPGVPSQPIAITQRIVCNLYTAKRLMHVLQLTIERHEGAFGALETDVQRRVRRV